MKYVYIINTFVTFAWNIKNNVNEKVFEMARLKQSLDASRFRMFDRVRSKQHLLRLLCGYRYCRRP